MHLTDVSAEDSRLLLAAPNAMSIVALERQKLHEKIVRLRALREAAEAAPSAFFWREGLVFELASLEEAVSRHESAAPGIPQTAICWG